MNNATLFLDKYNATLIGIIWKSIF